ncbi:MAG: hypothetical protein M3Z13_01680, partial [Candidatus Dormibacteraeota bacterium]|nr:hypothetical protein [Candidatus Dormibacteraeota bacterium]
WIELRATPFPGGRSADARLHEIALFDAWLQPIVEASLARAGRLSPSHREMLEQRRLEGNRELWAAAGELGGPARSYFAKLVGIEEALGKLPLDQPLA